MLCCDMRLNIFIYWVAYGCCAVTCIVLNRALQSSVLAAVLLILGGVAHAAAKYSGLSTCSAAELGECFGDCF